MRTAVRTTVTFLAAAGLTAGLALAQPDKNTKPTTTPARPAQPEKPKAPAGEKPGAQPGIPSPEEMKKMQEAYENAAKPGKMHEHLTRDAGTWEGKVKMWEAPGQPPKESTCTSVLTPVFDGLFVKDEVHGTMMDKPFHGLGIYGFDNASQKFQVAWIDNFGSGIMNGTGELSSDGKTLTWTMTGNDPITKKPKAMREVDRHTGDDAMVMEMYEPGMDGKEMKIVEISFKRTSKMPAAPSDATKPSPAPAKK